MKKNLLITADDFGFDSYRDKGILEAFQKGAIDQASLIVHGSRAEKAVESAQRAGMPLNLHLDLTESPDPLGKWPRLGKQKFFEHEILEKHSPDQFADDIFEQIEKFEKLTGSNALHIDGHHHTHVFPSVRESLQKIIHHSPIRSIRIPDDYDTHTLPYYAQIKTWAQESRLCYKKLQQNDAFFGTTIMGSAMSSAKLETLFSSICKDGFKKIELMVHPGYPNSEGTPFSKTQERQHELEALIDWSRKNA